MRPLMLFKGKKHQLPKTTPELFGNLSSAYIQYARSKMLKLIDSGQAVSIDDVHKTCPPPDYIDKSKVMRRIFMHHDFKRVATVQSKLTGNQNRYVGQYRRAYITTLKDI